MRHNLNNSNDTTLSLKWLNVVFLLLIAWGGVVSCEKPDFADDDDDIDSGSSSKLASLTVKTRGAVNEDGEMLVSYPVNVYVFDDSGKCIDSSVLDGESDKLSFSLNEGTYNVYAIGGADEESYSLPTKDKAQATSAVALNANMENGDLMAAGGNVILKKGEKNTLTLNFTRKVALIESMAIDGLPSGTTAVEVTLSPLAKYIQLDGNTSEETSSKTFVLNETSTEGSWSCPSTHYVTESTEDLTIKVNVTIGGIKTSYSSNYKGKLEANRKVSIKGHFDEDSMTLEGVLAGAKWGDPLVIDFNVNNSSSSDDSGSSSGDDASDNDGDDTPIYGNAPKVGSLYDNCVVIKAVSSDKSTTVTLMSLDEYNKLSYSKSQKGKDNEKFQAAISACVDETLAFYDDESLRLPTLTELEYIADNRETINEYIENVSNNSPLIEQKGGAYYCGYYYRDDDGNIYVYTLDGQIDKEPNPNRVTYKVRGFKTLSFTE